MDQIGTNVQENYYELLGCSETASAEEIKRNYQMLAKKFHPDKQEGPSLSGDRFIHIDKAYKTLKDQALRKEYDASLLKQVLEKDFLIYAELSRDELDFTSDNIAFYVCQCGENFIIKKEQLVEEGLVMECSQCSNSILVL